MAAAVAAAFGAPCTPVAMAQSQQVLEEQRAQYDALRRKTIVELQPFRRETSALLPESGTELHLTSLNPAVNAWFLLQVGADGARDRQVYHLENPDPAGQSVLLSQADLPALMVGDRTCRPWVGAPSELQAAHARGVPFAPICDGRLYLRNQVPGTRTTLERTTDFLRDHVWKGEEVVRFVRDKVLKDAEIETGNVRDGDGSGLSDIGPGPARVVGGTENPPQIIAGHGLGLSGVVAGRMTAGAWYPVADLDDVYVSAIQPGLISAEVLNGPGRTNRLDSVESRATAYMVAFDLTRLELGFALGTDHPGVGWSPRPPANIHPRGVPGPDGINTAKPLVRLGMVSPTLTHRTIAAFTGGFKRQHGAFKYGDLRAENFGSHYGFVEKGVIFSKLQPNLSTVFVLTDGTVGMKTWTEADNALLPKIEFARQNGVALLETDPETGLGLPGPRVTQWGAGNWSGSAKAELRTLRAGLCLRHHNDRQFLIYGYFSTATPSAMSRTFQAYGCSYAMLSDMNALEHTYLALYVRQDGKLHVQHLVPGMEAVDTKNAAGEMVPRFIGLPDNRDLFYVMQREDRS